MKINQPIKMKNDSFILIINQSKRSLTHLSSLSTNQNEEQNLYTNFLRLQH
jgi:hypothetical protein